MVKNLKKYFFSLQNEKFIEIQRKKDIIRSIINKDFDVLNDFVGEFSFLNKIKGLK